MRRVTYKLLKRRDKFVINLNFNHDNGRFRKWLGIAVNPTYWSKEAMRVKSQYDNQFEVNKVLDLYDKLIMDAYYKSVADGVRLTKGAIIEAIAPGKQDNRKGKAVDFKTFFENVIKARQRDGCYSKHTIKHYQACLRVLVAFEKQYHEPIHFDLIDTGFLEAFKHWLVHKRRLSTNSVAKHFRVLATFLKVALKRKIPINPDILAYRIQEIPSHNIYLTMDELRLLNGYDYRSERLRNAMDIFLIGCFTALRYSDFSKFTLEHIRKVRGVEMIFIKQQKTGDDVVIPLHPIVREIIDRNAGMPKMLSSQKLNDYIKEACQVAGINQPIVHYYNSAGRNLSKIVQKWELVASHTARRSCATNMHIAGIDSKLIMKLTGHRKESTFMKYICIENEDAALLLSKSGFFS